MQTRGWTITADLEGKSLLTVNAETASEEASAIFLSTEQVRWNANKQDCPAMMKLIPPKAQGLRPLLDSLIKGVSMKHEAGWRVAQGEYQHAGRSGSTP
jgi:hypothetical protein